MCRSFTWTLAMLVIACGLLTLQPCAGKKATGKSATIRRARQSQRCPNNCNGHGLCYLKPTLHCTCFPGYEGGDCSLLQCPKGKRFFDVFNATSTEELTRFHEIETECSGAGNCNRESGICRCRENFRGRACEFFGCPINENGDECNGHGFCKTLEELAETRTPDGEGEIFTYRSRWDRDMVEACQCDLSWTGYDCSEKRCLSGVDPKRLRKESFDREKQRIQCDCTVGNGKCRGELYAWFKGYRTRRLDAQAVMLVADERAGKKESDPQSSRETSFEYAIHSFFPFGLITKVSASTVGGVAQGPQRICNDGLVTHIDIEFQSRHGDAPEILIESGVKAGTVNVPLTVTTLVDGTTPVSVCSSRGVCNKNSGGCSCINGFRFSDGEGGAGSIPDCGFEEEEPTDCPSLFGDRECSGHGTCDRRLKVCTCDGRWRGVRCDQEDCGSHVSWGSRTVDHDKAHPVEECSGKGKCNENGGRCSCHAQFSGHMCQRLNCPLTNEGRTCAGRGMCLSLREVSKKSTVFGEQPGGSELQTFPCNATSESDKVQIRIGSFQTIKFQANIRTQRLQDILEDLPLKASGWTEIWTDSNHTYICPVGQAEQEINVYVRFSRSIGDVPPMAVTYFFEDQSSILVNAKQIVGPSSAVVYGQFSASEEELELMWDADMMHGCLCDGYPDFNRTSVTGDKSLFSGYNCVNQRCSQGADPHQKRDDCIGSGEGLYPEMLSFNCSYTEGYIRFRFLGVDTRLLEVSNTTVVELLSALSSLSSIGNITSVNKVSSDELMCNGLQHILSINSPIGDLPDIFIDQTRAHGGELISTQTDSTVIPSTCSNRGTCMEDNGICECFDFYESSDGVGGRGQRGDCGFYDPSFVGDFEFEETDIETDDELLSLLQLLDPIGRDDL